MKKIQRIIGTTLAAILCLEALCVLPAQASDANGFSYEHDPRYNQSAMEDINYDPEAWYGFSPDPESERLGVYAAYDFSDPVLVSTSTEERVVYLDDFSRMYMLWDSMKAQGKSTEEIARAVSALRNEIRLEAYKNNPEGLRDVKASNLKKYGNENGPTVESLYEKYGSWEKVLLKSFSPNAGMDACLGLYDIEYKHNTMINGSVPSTAYYTVKKNDSLSKIANKYYANQALWKKIYTANKAIIPDTYILQPGMKLEIPLD